MTDLVEELLVGKDGGILLHDLRKRAATALEAKDKEIEALRKDRDFWKSERDRIRAFLSEGDCLMLESEQAWKARAETAERRVAELEGMLSPESDHPTRNVGLLYQQARAEAAERKLVEARAALKPFAAIANEYSNQEDDDFQVWKDFDVLGASLPLRIFRAARAVIDKE